MSTLFGKNRGFRYKKVENRRFVRDVSRGCDCHCARLSVEHGILELRKPILLLFAWVARLGYGKIAKDFKSLVFFRRNGVLKNDMFTREKMVSQMMCFLGDFWGPRAPGTRSAAICVGRAPWRPGVSLFTWVARPGGQDCGYFNKIRSFRYDKANQCFSHECGCSAVRGVQEGAVLWRDVRL